MGSVIVLISAVVLCRWFCLPCRAELPRFTRFADTANHCLDQPIDTFVFVTVDHAEAKLRLVFGPFAEANGQLAAQIILDKGGLIPAFLYVPGVNAQRCEVTDMAFRPAGGGQEVLRLVARRATHAIQFEPCEWADICVGRSFAHCFGQIQLQDTRVHPADYTIGLAPLLRSFSSFHHTPRSCPLP